MLLQLYELFILLIYGQLILSVAQIIQHQMIILSVYNKLERILKEAAVAPFEVLSWNLPGGTEENQNKPQSGDLNPRL
jgi:hypothetical protein